MRTFGFRQAAGETLHAVPETQEDIDLWSEQKEYGDIMFVPDVKDSYRTSAEKMLKFYSALHQAGRKYWALVKLDDDAVLLPGRIWQVSTVDVRGPPVLSLCNRC